MVAVKADTAAAEQAAISTLRSHGAMHVEKADGQWGDGEWIDFDPVCAPVILYSGAVPASSQPAAGKGK
jgi:hypothetical protein